MSMTRDSRFQLDLKSRSEVELCWQKLDRKTKKLNWMVTQSHDHLNKKAGKDTIESVQEMIEGLEIKLDQISQNIFEQY